MDAALAYAGRGWPVFPRRADKVPLTDHGIYDATIDPSQIREWWTRWAWASIGITTGGAIDVLDVDTHGGDGFATLRDVQVPPTLTATTPRGGRHLFFRHLAGSRTRKIGPGLEWISVGPPPKHAPGNVVVPPGPGREWITEGEAMEAPEWLRELVFGPDRGLKETITAARGSSYQHEVTRNMPLRSRSILRVIERASNNERTPALFWAACVFGEIGVPEKVGEQLLMGSARDVGLVRDYGAERVRRHILNGMRIGADRRNPAGPTGDSL
jgi:hypothetical protein